MGCGCVPGFCGHLFIIGVFNEINEQFNIIAEQEHCAVIAYYKPLSSEDNGYQSEAA